MTVENLHDAIGQLPSDLIAKVDERRSRKPKVIPLRRHIAMAACLALILGGTFFFTRLFAPKGATEMAAAEAPAEAAMQYAAAPAAVDPGLGVAEDAAAPKSADAVTRDTTTETFSASTESASATASQDHAKDHTHTAATQPQTVEDPVNGWCGNTKAVLYIDGQEHVIWGSDAIAVTDILINMNYDPAKICRCMAEYTADTETASGYEINLTERFVRFGDGQADLTEEQVDSLQKIIESLDG